jgi:glycosyltransferase involved in cell wall biosynthesis
MRHAQSISVVITTYNRPDALEAVVGHVLCRTTRISKSLSLMMARLPTHVPVYKHWQPMRRCRLRHVWQPDAGFRAAMARNRGTLAANGEYIVFLDGDCIPQRDFIARHRALSQPGCLVSGSRILLERGLTRRVLEEGIDVAATNFATRRLAPVRRDQQGGATGRALARPGAHLAQISWRRIKSCNLGVWRSDLERVNGFDESFTGWGHEDSDLVVRLFHAGVMRKDGPLRPRCFTCGTGTRSGIRNRATGGWCWNGRRAR